MNEYDSNKFREDIAWGIVRAFWLLIGTLLLITIGCGLFMIFIMALATGGK
jgi:hypothetical protein